MAVILAGLVRLMRRFPRAHSNFKREASVSFTSAVIYSLMSVPFFWPRLLRMLDANLQRGYVWLPFWYAFNLTTTLGSFYEVAACSAKGTLLGVFAMVFLNYLVPGGATAYSATEEAEEHSWTRWLGKGYHPFVVWMFTACFVYSVFLARSNTCMKQYALGFYSPAIVDFMNPATNSSIYQAVLWTYMFRFNWRGTVASTVFITLLAIPLAGLSLPILLPCCRKLRRFFSCRGIASEGLATLAEDTWKSLERLITYFSEDDLRFDMERSFAYIRQLGTRRTHLESLLEQAKWECYNETTRSRLRFLAAVASLLQELRTGLRVQLIRVQQIRENAAYKYHDELGPHLNGFVLAMRDGLSYLTEPSMMHRGLTTEELDFILTSAAAADAALVEALDGVPSGRIAEGIFIDCLRNFPYALKCFAEQEIAKRGKTPKTRYEKLISRDWWPCRGACCMREQHLIAIRNTISWLLALSWSCLVRRAGCVTTVSFVFSPGLGSLFDRNINRILGVGIGLALGSLPAVTLLKFNCYTDQCFLHPSTGPAIYVLLMFAQWACSMWGYLATGSKYSYACLLWAGFGGVQMLQGMHTPFGRHGTLSESELFVSIMDNMLGCFIVFGVDVASSSILAGRSIEQVAFHISRSFEEMSRHFSKLQSDDGLVEVEELEELENSTKASRHWDEEAKKEDFVWTNGGLVPYKQDLVDAVLGHVDNIYVALWSFLTAARRGKQSQIVKSIIREHMPADLPAWCGMYSCAVKAALCAELGHYDEVRDRAPDPGRDDSRKHLDAFLNEQGKITPDQAMVLVMRADCYAVRRSFLKIHAVMEEDSFWDEHDQRDKEDQKREEDDSEEPLNGLRRERSWLQASVLPRTFSGLSDEADEDEAEEDDRFTGSSSAESIGGHSSGSVSSGRALRLSVKI